MDRARCGMYCSHLNESWIAGSPIEVDGKSGEVFGHQLRLTVRTQVMLTQLAVRTRVRMALLPCGKQNHLSEEERGRVTVLVAVAQFSLGQRVRGMDLCNS